MSLLTLHSSLYTQVQASHKEPLLGSYGSGMGEISGIPPPVKQAKFESLVVDFDEKLYVDRTFATLEDLSKQMTNNQDRQAVLVFIGPSGTGKTTILKVLYCRMQRENKELNLNFLYIDAKYSDIDYPAKGTYIFVDNAQCLQQKPKLVGYLHVGKSFCFSFSPVIVGSSISGSGFQFTEMYNFRPFTHEEIAEKHKGISGDVVKEVKKIGVLFPRILYQCPTPSHVEEWIQVNIRDFMMKIHPRLQSDSRVDELRTMIMKAAMSIELTAAERSYANTTGLFYVDDSGVLQLLFPADILQPHLYNRILSCYSMFNEYDKRTAFEFLVCAQLMSKDNCICCMGGKPTPVGDKSSSTSYSNGKPEFHIPAANQYIVQTDCGDDLRCERSCSLVKLYESHFGIDFLIIFKPVGSGSNKLLLIQASVTKYSR